MCFGENVFLACSDLDIIGTTDFFPETLMANYLFCTIGRKCRVNVCANVGPNLLRNVNVTFVHVNVTFVDVCLGRLYVVVTRDKT